MLHDYLPVKNPGKNNRNIKKLLYLFNTAGLRIHVENRFW